MNTKLIKTFDKQRAIDKYRVKELVKYQNNELKKDGKVKVRGTIILCQINENLIILHNSIPTKNSLYIIDGQHRYHALAWLIKKEIIDDCDIITEIIHVSNDEEMFKEFQDINKGVPVPINYLNPNEIVNSATSILTTTYPKAFSKTPNTRRPYISIDKFKDAIIKSDLVNKLSINSAQELVKKIQNLNSQYQEWGPLKLCDHIARNNKQQRQIVINAYNQCKANNKYLFLGLFKNNDWITDIMSSF